MEGSYQFVRNPMYSAIIFILNPALGILFRSWLLFLAAIPVYFVWKKCVKIEEQDLEQKFGQSYLVYQRNVWRFFPNLWRVNKVLFYAVAGILIFAVTFVGLNFSAFYLRWVTWDSQGEITYDQKPKKEFNFGQASSFSSYKAAYNPSSNSIIINKINVKAPIVSASGTTQKELNSALNQGAVLYPGSVLPGQSGEVFLTAHSSVYPWNKTIYGQVFSLLDKLETGDIVSVVYNNYQYDYQITGKVILNASEVKIREIYEPRLTLMTCWPIGTSLKRLVVYGELVR
jgi:LPXTG-site transpeptidase (sortase) family protein